MFIIFFILKLETIFFMSFCVFARYQVFSEASNIRMWNNQLKVNASNFCTLADCISILSYLISASQIIDFILD